MRIYPEDGKYYTILFKTLILITEKGFSKSKITDLEQTLSGKGFVRIHRSFIINSVFVTAFSTHEVIVGPHHIPVGRSYKQEFETFISSVSKNKLL